MVNMVAPVEILLQVFTHLEKADLRRCLLVNKTWNTIANLFFDEGLHIQTCGTKRLYKDLVDFPEFASKVTKLTVNTRTVHYWLKTLQCCPNLLVLDFGYHCRRWKLLNQLGGSDVQLPNLEEILVHSFSESSPQTSYIWTCLQKYSASITRLNIDFSLSFYYGRGVIDCISYFPKLQNVEALYAVVKSLHNLLLQSRDIKKLVLRNCIILEDNANCFIETCSNLQELRLLECEEVHINALRLTSQVLDKLELCEVGADSILVEEGQDLNELEDLRKYFPDLTRKVITSNDIIRISRILQSI